MSTPSTMPETTRKPENEVEAAGFDIDKALNTKGFMEFLAKHPDAKDLDMGNSGELQKRFEVFGIKDGVSKGLEKVYSSHIKDQIGLKLEGDDTKSVKEYIEKLAVEEPEKVYELNKKLKTLTEVPAEIQGLEAELAKLGEVSDLMNQLRQAGTLENDLEAVIPTMGSLKYKAKYALALLAFAPSRGWKGFEDVGYVEAAKDKFNLEYGKQKVPEKGEKVVGKEQLEGILRETTQRIEDIKATLDKVGDARDLKTALKASFDNARKDLVSGMAEIKGLTEAVNERSCAELKKMMEPGTLDALQKAQERLEFLQFAAYNPDAGVEPLTTNQAGQFQEEIDKAVESNIPEKIWQIVLDADLGSNALTNIEKKLDPFLKANKLGSKEGDDARAFIKEIIEKIVNERKPQHPEGEVKRLILKRILVKLGKS